MASLLKKLLPLLLLLTFCPSLLFAQRPLTKSRQSSFYTYIYKLNAADVSAFYKTSKNKPGEQLMHTLTDSFKTDKYWENTLPAGNYLKVHAENNVLKYTLIENHTAFVKLFGNNVEYRFALTDKQGNYLTKATALLNGKQVMYDDKSGTWHFKPSKDTSVLQIDYAGVSNFYSIIRYKYKPYSYKGVSANWFSRLWRSVKNIFHTPVNKYAPSPYTGFMVFNKPMYKPRDTVKFKAFALYEGSKRPVKYKNLIVKLVEDGDEDAKTIGTVNSYRDGGFEYSFVLADSLDLSLDENYRVKLMIPNSKPKNSADNDDEDDEDTDEKTDKVNTIISGTFKYEEYELKGIKFNTRLDKEENRPGNPMSVYLKATDQNDLPVADGRVTLTIIGDKLMSFTNSQLFVPDTLWVHKLTLDPVGETKVVIPDSIFPKADIGYSVHAAFLNADNELQEDEKQASFKYQRFNLNTKVVGDSLKIDYEEYGRQIKGMALVSALNADDDTLSATRLMLPGLVKINPNADNYAIETDSLEKTLEVSQFEASVAISGERTADSVFINIDNPRNLPLYYSVYAGGKLIDAGQGKSINYKQAYSKHKIIQFIVNYVWAGKAQQRQNSFAYNKDALNIAVKQPLSVYPGQKATTDIVVTDATGKPVANADITAWALTRKFTDYSVPFVPYLGKSYPAVKRGVGTINLLEKEIKGAFKLDWLRQSRRLGLDSIEYYRFTHPSNIYRIEEPGIDTITQVAPFVALKGDLLPVHVLYIDERPVYFSQAQQLQPYSFKVSPGLHSLRFRTANLNVRLDSIKVEPSKKLILSINADAYASTKMPDTLNTYEADLLNKYMVTIVNNFEGKRSVLTEEDRVFLLNASGAAGSNVLAGPLANNYAFYEHQGQKPQPFLAEPGYSYLFEPGFLKQKSILGAYPFSKKLLAATGATNHIQYVLTNKGADSLWQNYLDERSHNRWLFNNPAITENETGVLVIEQHQETNQQASFIKNIIIYKPDEADFMRVFPGNVTDFGRLAAGAYKIFFLLKDDNYDVKDNVKIKPNGTNYYTFDILPVNCKDSVSMRISNVISNRYDNIYRNDDNQIMNDALKLKEAFNEKYLTPNFTGLMSGQVTAADDKLPLPGVAVKVKGTSMGTQTDINGRFKLSVPAKGKLLFNFIGYYPKEVNIEQGKAIHIKLDVVSQSLSEVVVIGYGSQRKKYITGSVSTVYSEGLLMGRAAGVTITEGAPGAGPTIMIRGISSLSTGSKPLYVVDGEVTEGIKNINVDDIAEISVLKNAAGTALYGLRAANGVIIITTKRQKTGQASNATIPGSEQTLRRNFSDYAYWQPKLTTDENGKASFTTVFPDDITNWRTFVAGINGNRQSGFAENQVKSFRPLSANFIAPQFAVAGDEMSLIGKVMNYNAETATVNRSFIYNGKTLKKDALQVKNAKIDTLNITAAVTDSLTFEYSIKRDNGYFDGERRVVPVYKPGVKETKGVFEALNRDTTVTLKFDPALGPVIFRAEASMLPALADEAMRLREYKYLCNEQLASKLKGLLVEKRIKAQFNEPFKYEKNIGEIIKKLQENRKTSGAWGWWKDSSEELWISLHAVEALVDAKSMGYDVLLYAQKLTDYLVYQLESYNSRDKVTCLQILFKLKAKVDYPKYIAVIATERARSKTLSNYDRFKLMLLKQETGDAINIDSLLTITHKTLFGNIYWGDDSYRFFDNSIQQSILAYHIIKNDGKHLEILEKIRGYFLEQRKLGEWRNTYESALILETILPGVLNQAKKVLPATITVKGSDTKTITKFPYTDTLTVNQLTVNKTGSLPVYISGYQQFWNSAPQKVNKDFTVNSWFEKNGKNLSQLKAGEAVLLNVEVTAKGDGDYVMVEVPIPAGCSYQEKEQQWDNNEVHREHYKEKVSIFCSKLKQGTYTFTISLMPRYSGKYTFNPAKAELMYFPVFYGRDGMKNVVIGN
ncbi:hypothetical protein EWM62_18150 [Mucilaginibacter terrigena]|uniref:Alpha-2-macroglobulin domain-containing protein n=1 Tax=Mucilaginibacter terrigena TaxID=2492395 RepID=A0A4V1ZBE9_9SPHI|nr:carboxypeptidase-like regulatory domain-containing protein [Mucilaginibacter terrigena]RYU86576.1 hypothetical protein EWM62_18150 [Mucilaginibacter terrigena]